MIQLIIIIYGGISIWLLSNTDSKWFRWGYVFGLAAEPAWIWTSIENRQWGILLMCVWYSIMFMRGIYKSWKR